MIVDTPYPYVKVGAAAEMTGEATTVAGPAGRRRRYADTHDMANGRLSAERS
jgi:hypothetical protein